MIKYTDVLKIPDGISGIYFLYNAGLLVYIGKSVEVKGRIISHIKKDAFSFDTIGLITYSDKRFLCFYENKIIRKIQPPFNTKVCRMDTEWCVRCGTYVYDRKGNLCKKCRKNKSAVKQIVTNIPAQFL